MSVRRAPVRGSTARETAFSRYDVYLALLPAPLLLGVVWALLSTAPVSYGAGVGSLGSAFVLGHVLFRDAPTTGGDDRPGGRRGGVPADD